MRLFWPYIALGRLGSLIGAPGIMMFQAGRFAAGVLLVLGLCALARELGIGPWWVPLAGFFWCGSEVLVGSFPVPEMRVAWAALTLPHFALSQAAACWCLAFWLRACRSRARWTVAAGVACAMVGSVHPYVAALLVGGGVCRGRGVEGPCPAGGRKGYGTQVAGSGVRGRGRSGMDSLGDPAAPVGQGVACSEQDSAPGPVDSGGPAGCRCGAAGAEEWLRSGREDAGMAAAVRKRRAMAVLLVVAVLAGPVAFCVRPVLLGASDLVRTTRRSLTRRSGGFRKRPPGPWCCPIALRRTGYRPGPCAGP